MSVNRQVSFGKGASGSSGGGLFGNKTATAPSSGGGLFGNKTGKLFN
jgi:hypothetical protein